MNKKKLPVPTSKASTSEETGKKVSDREIGENENVGKKWISIEKLDVLLIWIQFISFSGFPMQMMMKYRKTRTHTHSRSKLQLLIGVIIFFWW